MLASASNTDVAECLALSLAPPMSFPPFCTMKSLNPIYDKKVDGSNLHPTEESLLQYFSLTADFT